VKFGSVVTYDDDKFLAGQYGVTQEAIAPWRDRATHEALKKLRDNAKAAIDLANDPEDCEVEDLLLLTGSSFDRVIQRLLPKMMELQSGLVVSGSRRLVWIPDRDARKWILKVQPLAELVKRQQFQAQVDTNLTLMILGIATLPAMLAEGTTAFMIAAAIDALDLVITSISEISEYSRSVQGRRITRNLNERPIADLDQSDLRDFQAFALDAKAKSIEEGMDSLTDTQRKAVSAVDSLSSRRADATTPEAIEIPSSHPTGTGREPGYETVQENIELPTDHRTVSPSRGADETAPDEIEIPPANQADMDDVRFEIDPGSGKPVMRSRDSSSIYEGTAPPPRGPPEVVSTPRNVPEEEIFNRELIAAAIGNNKKITFTDEAGEQINLPVSKQMGDTGSTSAFYQKPANEGKRYGWRVTFNDPRMQHAVKLDKAGRKYLEEIGDSPYIRVVDEVRHYDLPPAVAEEKGILRVAEVELVEEIADDVIVRNADGTRPMSVPQREAYIKALEELNKRGYVWLDNKPNNFAFEDNGVGGLKIVVIDTGGIVRVKSRGDISAADMAREVQSKVNLPFEEVVTDMKFAKEFHHAVKKGDILDSYGDVLDVDDIGISIEQVEFNAMSGDLFPLVADHFRGPLQQ
jgi:hypothetical protein